MGLRPHGHASVDTNAPRAWGTCDRCGFIYNLRNLQFQFDWRGEALSNLRLLVCDKCLDTPSPWYRAIVLPPDPPALINARPEAYAVDETDWISSEPSPSTPQVIVSDESGADTVVDESSAYQP